MEEEQPLAKYATAFHQIREFFPSPILGEINLRTARRVFTAILRKLTVTPFFVVFARAYLEDADYFPTIRVGTELGDVVRVIQIRTTRNNVLMVQSFKRRLITQICRELWISQCVARETARDHHNNHLFTLEQIWSVMSNVHQFPRRIPSYLPYPLIAQCYHRTLRHPQQLILFDNESPMLRNVLALYESPPMAVGRPVGGGEPPPIQAVARPADDQQDRRIHIMAIRAHHRRNNGNGAAGAGARRRPFLAPVVGVVAAVDNGGGAAAPVVMTRRGDGGAAAPVAIPVGTTPDRINEIVNRVALGFSTPSEAPKDTPLPLSRVGGQAVIYSPEPSKWFSENLDCILCTDVFAPGDCIVTCPGHTDDDGVVVGEGGGGESSGGEVKYHQFCTECFSRMVQQCCDITTPEFNMYRWKNLNGEVVCLAGFPEREAALPIFLPDVVFQAATPAMSRVYTESKVASKSEKIADETSAIAKKAATEAIREILQPESEKEKRLRIIAGNVKHIQERILTLRCPTCDFPYAEYDKCSALTCSTCGSHFCGLCGEIGSTCTRTIHEHVKTCPWNPEPGGFAFINDNVKAAINRCRLHRLMIFLRTAFLVHTAYDVTIRFEVVTQIGPDLAHLGLPLTELEHFFAEYCLLPA